MRAAGAFPFARTNLPDFGLRVHTHSSLHGLTRNPWNPSVTAGGSSGGEGSALAVGDDPARARQRHRRLAAQPGALQRHRLDQADDGVVPRASALPPEDTQITGQLMLVEGVMARHVADVRAGLLAVAGAHHRDPVSVPARLAEPEPAPGCGSPCSTEPPGGRTDPGIAAAIRGAADALADAGHRVADAVPSSYARAHELWQGLLGGDIAVVPAAARAVHGRRRHGVPRVHRRGVPAGDDRVVVVHVRRAARASPGSGRRSSSEWDVLLSPTWSLPAFAHGADIASAEGALAALETIRSVTPQNLLGLPAAVVPAGASSAATGGLPVGAQFTANRFGELTALAAAQALEDIVGAITPIDPVRS